MIICYNCLPVLSSINKRGTPEVLSCFGCIINMFGVHLHINTVKRNFLGEYYYKKLFYFITISTY